MSAIPDVKFSTTSKIQRIKICDVAKVMVFEITEG